MKRTIKKLAARSGLYVANVDRFGIDADNDLARLTTASPLRTIFDIGANFGQTARRYSAAFPNATIHSFEPVPDSFARLRTATAALPNARIHNFAMGEHEGHAPIHIASSAGSNSLQNAEGAQATIEVKVNTVDQVCSTEGIDGIDLLKIDVEGFELQVLRGALGRLDTGRVRYVFAECVMNPAGDRLHTNFFGIHQLLSAKGFCFVSFYAESFSLKGGCAMGNVLWALQNQLPESVPGRVRNIF